MIAIIIKQLFQNPKNVLFVYTPHPYQYNINIILIKTDSNRFKPIQTD